MDGEFSTGASNRVPWGPAAGILSLTVSLAATTYNIGRLQQQPAQPAAAPAVPAAVAVAQPAPPTVVAQGRPPAASARLSESETLRRIQSNDPFAAAPQAAAPAAIVEIKPTGRTRASTVGPAPEPPKLVAVDYRPVVAYPYYGAPIYAAPAYDAHYGRPCPSPYGCGVCRPHARRHEEPLLPFNRSTPGHRSERSYSQQTSGFTTR